MEVTILITDRFGFFQRIKQGPLPKKRYRYSSSVSYEEQLNLNLGGNYLITKTSDGNYLARSSPLTFTSYKRGSEKKYDTYTPHELVIDPSGNVISEVKRGIYTRDKLKDGYMQSPYEKEVTNYKDQTKKVYTTRELKSGRETIKLKEKTEGGYSKKYEVNDQAIDEKKQPPRTTEQAKLIRNEGFTVMNTQRYADAGKREQSFKAPKSQFRDYRGATYQGSSKDTPVNYMKDIFSRKDKARRQKHASFYNYLGAERIQNRPDSQRINTMRGLASDQVVSKKQRSNIRITETATQNNNSLAGFEKRIEDSNKRQDTFFNSENFQNVRKTARWMTFGKTDVPYEHRSFAGKTAENVVFGLMSGPIAVGGVFPMVGEKLAATGEAIYHPQTRSKILPELKRAGKETLSNDLNPTKPEGLATYISSGVFATTMLPAARTSYPVRTGMKLLYKDKYVPPAKTGIKFIEDYTVKTSLAELESLEGKKVPSVHVSPRELPFDSKSQFVTKAFPETAGKFRSRNKLLQFYKSSPQVLGDVKVSNYQRIRSDSPGSKLPQSAVKESMVSSPDYRSYSQDVGGYKYTRYQARAYLGYVGIGKAASSSPKVIYGKPVIQVLIFRNKITPTPKSIKARNLDFINRWQGRQSGETFVPAENIKGMSPEGQFITPAKYEGIKGYEDMQGSIIQRKRQKFTYYTQKFDNPYSNPVARSGWQLFGRKKEIYKIDLIEADTKPVGNFDVSKSPKLDMARYNEEYYQGQRYARSSSPRYKSIVSSPALSSSYSSIVRSSARSYASGSGSSSQVSSSFGISSVSSGFSSSPRVSSVGSGYSGSSIGRSSTASSLTSSSTRSSPKYPYYSYGVGLKQPPKESSLLRFRGTNNNFVKKDRTPKGKRSYEYMPDIASSAFDIEAKLGKRMRFNLQRSGLSIRPIPI